MSFAFQVKTIGAVSYGGSFLCRKIVTVDYVKRITFQMFGEIFFVFGSDFLKPYQVGSGASDRLRNEVGTVEPAFFAAIEGGKTL